MKLCYLGDRTTAFAENPVTRSRPPGWGQSICYRKRTVLLSRCLLQGRKAEPRSRWRGAFREAQGPAAPCLNALLELLTPKHWTSPIADLCVLQSWKTSVPIKSPSLSKSAQHEFAKLELTPPTWKGIKWCEVGIKLPLLSCSLGQHTSKVLLLWAALRALASFIHACYPSGVVEAIALRPTSSSIYSPLAFLCQSTNPRLGIAILSYFLAWHMKETFKK